MITTLGGEAVIVWPFRPDTPISEQVEWKTDILPAYAGEQRIALRKPPRQTFGYKHFCTAREQSRIRNYTRHGNAGTFAVPLWWEASDIGAVTAADTVLTFDTRSADYRDAGYAIVWGDADTCEVVTITTVADGSLTLSAGVVGSYTRAVVAPVRLCLMPNAPAEISRPQSIYANVQVKFHVKDVSDTIRANAAPTTFPTYRTYDVMNIRPINREAIDASIVWPQNVLDNGTGDLFTDKARSQSFTSSLLAFDSDAGTDMWDIRGWVYSNKGRQGAFWVPSYNADLVATTTIGAANTTITVEHVDFTTVYPDGADIMILLNNGAAYYRQVTSSVDNGTTETLTITALGSLVTTAEIEMICIMKLSRLDADRIEFVHREDRRASLRVPVIEVFV